MKIVSFQCPYCGGVFQIDPENRQFAFCGHCGQKIIIDDGVKRSEHKEIKVDEARIHEADIKERIRLRELELEIEDRKRESKMFTFKVIATAVMLLAEVFFVVFASVRCDMYGGSDSLGSGMAILAELWFMIAMVVLALLFTSGRRKEQ